MQGLTGLQPVLRERREDETSLVPMQIPTLFLSRLPSSVLWEGLRASVPVSERRQLRPHQWQVHLPHRLYRATL